MVKEDEKKADKKEPEPEVKAPKTPKADAPWVETHPDGPASPGEAYHSH